MIVNERMLSERQMMDLEVWQRRERTARGRHKKKGMKGQRTQPSYLELKVKCQDSRHSLSITAIKAVSQQLPWAVPHLIYQVWQRERQISFCTTILCFAEKKESIILNKDQTVASLHQKRIWGDRGYWWIKRWTSLTDNKTAVQFRHTVRLMAADCKHTMHII